MDVMRQPACLVINPITVYRLHEGGSGFRLTDDTDFKWSVLEVCLRLGPRGSFMAIYILRGMGQEFPNHDLLLSPEDKFNFNKQFRRQ